MKSLEVTVPNTGVEGQLEVIEVCVKVGDMLEIDDAVIVLESDKATVEVPSPAAGKVLEVKVNLGDKIADGEPILILESEADADIGSGIGSGIGSDIGGSSELGGPESAELTGDDGRAATPDEAGVSEKQRPEEKGFKGADLASTLSAKPDMRQVIVEVGDAKVHAGPAVRKLARELGADLTRVVATGPRQRILKGDLDSYIKLQVEIAQSGSVSSPQGGVPKIELPDFSKFGSINTQVMNKIQRLTAENMHASWLTVPHVTQFDEADITEMESFRKSHKQLAEKKGLKLTPMPFLLKACAYAIQSLPQFNVSLDMQRHQIIQKHYIHIGVAVDTPNGLVVPVIRDVDQKNLWQLAEECQQLAARARDRKLLPAEMQGGCFTISSLGGIGGMSFTPIVNTPEVAILGVSKAQVKPILNAENTFDPRLMLPLSLSYDHRAVNGADAARFTTLLGRVLSDLRELLL